MRKIRIVTYHRAVNYGAVLQAYGLLSHLKQVFPNDDVKMLDYRSSSLEARNFLKAFKPNKKKIFFNFKRYWIFRKSIPKIFDLDGNIKYCPNFKELINRLNEQKYDLIVTGSDSIWKISHDPLLPGFPSIYWLSDKIKAKKISYAASAYQCNKELFNESAPKIKKTLSSFDLITVRDQDTMDLINSLDLNKPIYKIPDPAFYYKIRPTKAKEKLEKLGLDLNKPIFALITGSQSHRVQKIINHFREKGWQIIGLSIYNPLVDFNLGDELTPFEWGEVFKYLNFCLTDRFHGAIFCLKNYTPFVAIETKGVTMDRSKKYQLIKDFGLFNSYLDLNNQDYTFNDFKEKFADIETSWPEYKTKIDQTLKEIDQQNQEITEKIKNVL